MAQVAVAGVMFGLLVDDTATVIKLFQVLVLAVILNIAFFDTDASSPAGVNWQIWAKNLVFCWCPKHWSLNFLCPA